MLLNADLVTADTPRYEDVSPPYENDFGFKLMCNSLKWLWHIERRSIKVHKELNELPDDSNNGL